MAPAPNSVPGGPEGLSTAELEAESAEALPERAAMSTLNVASLDAATGSVEAVGDGVSSTAAAASEPVHATDAAPDATTTAEPVDASATSVQAGHETPDAGAA